MQRPIITLTTDFGTRDSYVGAMKGVILGLCPDAQLVDITHEIAPQDITAAAFVMHTCVDAFPAGTVHLVVVDPGVGTQRHPLALQTPLAFYVGPDNGVLSLILQAAMTRWSAAELRAVALSEPRFWRDQVSATFHGRDMFAPVAAYLARGVEIAAMGRPLPIDTLVKLPIPEPIWSGSQSLQGEVVYVDHFGNCVSNITATHLAQIGSLVTVRVKVGSHQFDSIKRTFGDVTPGTALALISSSGNLEIALRNGNASGTLQIAPGERVVLEWGAGSQTAPVEAPTPVASPHEEGRVQTVVRSRVLVVDDDQTICRTLKLMLEMEDYVVETVHDGADALQQMSNHYDVLITDLSMPNYDGLALVKYCRERGLDLPVIIMTGYGSLETAVRALQLGAYDYVLKPFDPMVLLAAVRRAAERQHLRRALEEQRHLETVTRLALTVRHEINNPLAAIMGLAQLHLDEPLDPDLHRDLETISRSAQRISEALQRLTHLRQTAETASPAGQRVLTDHSQQRQKPVE